MFMIAEPVFEFYVVIFVTIFARVWLEPSSAEVHGAKTEASEESDRERERERETARQFAYFTYKKMQLER